MTKPASTLTLRCAGDAPVPQLNVALANNFWARFRGLMLSASIARRTRGAQGLLITRCSSVHTAFMRYPIDVVYLDNAGVVLGSVHNLKPWRVHWCSLSAARHKHLKVHRPIHTLELSAGTAQSCGLEIGDACEHPVFRAQIGTFAAPAAHASATESRP